jgi:hypothetical protein
VLSADVSARATFSHGDSVTEPVAVGTADAFRPVLAGLLDEVAATGAALGVAATTPAAWLAALLRSDGGRGRCLDSYVEAQVHGGVDLRADVVAVVADPSLCATPTADVLTALADRYGVPLRHHPGFVLSPGEVPADLRGPVAPRLAGHLCDRYGTDHLDAALLGRAAAAVVRSRRDWAQWGDPAEVLQQLKYLWHILVVLGRPDPLRATTYGRGLPSTHE